MELSGVRRAVMVGKGCGAGLGRSFLIDISTTRPSVLPRTHCIRVG
jgi:hypothetical protein